MALTDIRKHNFYQKYDWLPADFANMQSWIWGALAALAEGAHGAAVLSGLEPVPAGSMNVQIGSGIASDGNGQPLVLAAPEVIAVPSPVGNPARSLIILRPTTENADYMPEPVNPSNSVPLTVKQKYTLMVLSGTPAGSPSYPATQAGDVVVAGVKLTAGHATIQASDFDYGVVSRPRKRKARIAAKTANFTFDAKDEIVEVDCTAGTVTGTLLPAASAVGEVVECVKVDSSANPLVVDGDGSELISGQANQQVDDQWGSLRLYSNGIAWRVI